MAQTVNVVTCWYQILRWAAYPTISVLTTVFSSAQYPAPHEGGYLWTIKAFPEIIYNIYDNNPNLKGHLYALLIILYSFQITDKCTTSIEGDFLTRTIVSVLEGK